MMHLKRLFTTLRQRWARLAPDFNRVLLWVQERRLPLALSGVALFLACFLLYGAIVRAPASFPHGKVVRIEEGSSLQTIAQLLEARGVVQSSFWFKVTAIIAGDQSAIRAGDYFFTRDRNLFEVVSMVTTGDYGLVPVKVTIPEGASVRDMARILSEQFNVFDGERFIALAEKKEGYLFPDTYFFLPNVSERAVLEVLEETFHHKIAELQPQIEAFGQPLEDVITMASIIEREARTTESRRMISGILWNRIEMGMPLQVDVTFDYINGKNSFTLTQSDLEIDSPYNTYRYVGLPPGPIASPSLDSIKAAINPTTTEYLFFLADRRGTVHYSETFEEHVQKKRMYLN